MLVTIVMLFLASSSKRLKSPLLAKYSFAITVAIVLGAVVEILQHFTGRNAEIRDLWNDALGAVAAAGGFLIFDPKVIASPQRKALQRTGLVSVITACVLILAPLANTASAYVHRHLSFPTLFDFSATPSTYFLGIHSPILAERRVLPVEIPHSDRGAVGLRVRLQDQNGWWRIFLNEPYGDWHGYNRLLLDLANPTGIPFLLKMHVRYQNQINVIDARYMTDIEIAPYTRQTFSVSLEYLTTSERMRHIYTPMVSSIVLNRNPANRGSEFFVMRVWLE
jgi:hypothetical protein